MNNMSIEKLINLIKTYNPDAVETVKKAYALAEILHKDQKRNSGEPYIIHPLNVAYILAEMHADCDTLCAGLLHDTLEDTEITKEEIASLFNEDIASLVDGVTKLAKMNFSTKEEQNLANTRKIITSITEDVRIIIIKLADRLHNMRTLEHKKIQKQKENALETLEIFAPLAYYIGAYRLKSELEDLSLKYLKPQIYQKLVIQKITIQENKQEYVEEMIKKISSLLTKWEIKHEIKVSSKNIYGIYRKLEQGYKLNEIHDLLAIKITVDNIKNCYTALGAVHNCYPIVPGTLEDFISNPKTNLYRSLNTTVFGINENLIQIRIKTKSMEKTASYGLSAHWNTHKGNARNIMQKSLRNKFQFYKCLTDIDSRFSDNQEFVQQIKEELFGNNVYAYTTNGNIIELPKGSTIIDYAYKVDPENAHNMIEAIVNDESVPLDYIIQSKDRIKIIISKLSIGPTETWEKIAKTSYARTRIKKFRMHTC